MSISFDPDTRELRFVERPVAGALQPKGVSKTVTRYPPQFVFECPNCRQIVYTMIPLRPAEIFDPKEFAESTDRHQVSPEYRTSDYTLSDGQRWMVIQEAYHFDSTKHYHHYGKCIYSRVFGRLGALPEENLIDAMKHLEGPCEMDKKGPQGKWNAARQLAEKDPSYAARLLTALDYFNYSKYQGECSRAVQPLEDRMGNLPPLLLAQMSSFSSYSPSRILRRANQEFFGKDRYWHDRPQEEWIDPAALLSA